MDPNQALIDFSKGMTRHVDAYGEDARDMISMLPEESLASYAMFLIECTAKCINHYVTVHAEDFTMTPNRLGMVGVELTNKFTNESIHQIAPDAKFAPYVPDSAEWHQVLDCVPFPEDGYTDAIAYIDFIKQASQKPKYLLGRGDQWGEGMWIDPLPSEISAQGGLEVADMCREVYEKILGSTKLDVKHINTSNEAS